MSTLAPELLAACKSYFEGKDILIVDSNSASRAGIARTLSDMGAKTAKITLLDDYLAGAEFIRASRPGIIVTDFELGNHSGLGFCRLMRELGINDAERLMVVVTGNSSQSAVADAAEEDVDAYILKPYTLIQLKSLIASAAVAKLRPSPYQEKIALGRKAMAENQWEVAKDIFRGAISLSEKPSLGYYYFGECEVRLERLSEAEESFKKGLSINPIHYKCLTGLCDVLTANKKSAGAYEVATKIASNFPLNPTRLSQTLRLAVVTGHYDDIEEFYKLFKEIDSRSEELVRYICAALVIGAKALFKEGKTQKAIQLMKDASVTAAGRPGILKGIVVSLLEQKLNDEAAATLKRFSIEDQRGLDFLTAKFQYDIASTNDPRNVIHLARTAIQQGLKDPIAYEVISRNYLMIEKPEMASEWAEKATTLWPEMKDKFKPFLKA